MVSTEASPLLEWRQTEVSGQVAAYGVGGTGPPIVFLHGWGLSGRTYKAALKRLLARGFRVWAPALPGFNGSHTLGAGAGDLAQYAQWVNEFLTAVGVDEPVVLMGHSFGGGVAIQTAHDWPEHVRGLVLINSIGGSAWRRDGSVITSMAKRPLWDWGLHFPSDVLPLRQLRRVLPVILQAAVPNALRDPRVFWHAATIARYADLTDELQELKARRLPVVVLWGKRDELVTRVLRRVPREPRESALGDRRGQPLVAACRPRRVRRGDHEHHPRRDGRAAPSLRDNTWTRSPDCRRRTGAPTRLESSRSASPGSWPEDCAMYDDGPVPHHETSEPGRRRRFRWLRGIALLVVAVLVGGAIPFAIAWSHRGAKEASIDRAVAEFRKSHGAAGAGFLRPASGVYTFVGTGTEKLSLLATTQRWGPHIPVTVTEQANDCWTFHVGYSTHHSLSTRYCANGHVLRETGETTSQTFDFVAFESGDTNDVVCDPPIDRIRVDAKPGSTWHAACDGHSKSRGTAFHAAGTETFVGVEQLRVGDDLVPVYHYSVSRTLSGSQTGSERYDVWYSVVNGLPVKTDRHVTVRSPSPIGAVTYTERGEYSLASLTPRR